MRYTKELQNNVCSDIKYGLTPQECAEKYKIPMAVVLKWNNLDMPVQRAKEIALRKYQVEVSEAEAAITDRLSPYLTEDTDDEKFVKICKGISGTLFALTSEIVRKERNLNPHEDPPDNAEIMAAITRKWLGNPFLKRFLEVKEG